MFKFREDLDSRVFNFAFLSIAKNAKKKKKTHQSLVPIRYSEALSRISSYLLWTLTPVSAKSLFARLCHFDLEIYLLPAEWYSVIRIQVRSENLKTLILDYVIQAF